MGTEARANTHKGISRRSRTPDPRELLDQLDTLDLRLLLWLLRYPFQRTQDLALATGISSATTYRHLGVLCNQGIVERVLPPALGMATCWLYHLSNLGLQVLAVHEHADPAELASTWKTDERELLRLLPRLASLVRLQECINGLVTYAPEALANLGRRSEVRWHWVRDYAHRFHYREKVMRYTADAALLLRIRRMTVNETSAQEQWYSLLVLLDADIVGDPWLKQRLGRILCYRESAERWPVYQHFPPVLVLVSTPRCMEHWHWCAREAAVALHVELLKGAVVCVPEKQHMESYNSWRLPWKTLGTGGPCTLRHLLHPLPIEAIPPNVWKHQTTDTVMQEKSRGYDGTATIISTLTRKHAKIIVGNLMEQAKAVQKDQTIDAYEERKIMALLGLSLGFRHLELLTLLFTHPLLHVHEIAVLFERETSSIERYLGVLRGSCCIEPLNTDRGKRWRLCKRGLRLIAAMHHVNVQHIASQQEGDEGVNLVQQGVDVLLGHLDHTAGIYEFFVSLSQAASQERLQGRDHRLLWWETGSSCERRYRDHDHWHNLRPDAFAEYQAGELRVRFWLEWDRGTMSTPDLAVKCTTYARYVASRAWFKQEAALPFLLVVTPNPGQERRLGRVARATITEECGLIIRTTTLTRMQEQGLLGPIWNQVLPYCEGNDLMPRRTFDL